jgi:hypothetical protein
MSFLRPNGLHQRPDIDAAHSRPPRGFDPELPVFENDARLGGDSQAASGFQKDVRFRLVAFRILGGDDDRFPRPSMMMAYRKT